MEVANKRREELSFLSVNLFIEILLMKFQLQTRHLWKVRCKYTLSHP